MCAFSHLYFSSTRRLDNNIFFSFFFLDISSKLYTLIVLISIFKSYPTYADVGFYLSFIPCWSFTHKCKFNVFNQVYLIAENKKRQLQFLLMTIIIYGHYMPS